MTVKDFGITKDGIATKLYTLKNNNLEISVTDFGSTLVSIVVPDRNNKAYRHRFRIWRCIGLWNRWRILLWL